jgi:hypothetical protein
VHGQPVAAHVAAAPAAAASAPRAAVFSPGAPVPLSAADRLKAKMRATLERAQAADKAREAARARDQG